jgi:hypothetical protein
MDAIGQSICQWLSSQWVQSDLASWLAVAIALGAAVIALRVARKASYVEFHPGWDIHIDEDTGDVEVKGKVTIVTDAAYVDGKGKLIFGCIKKDIIPVTFVEATPHMLHKNEMTLVFKGKTIPKFNSNRQGKFLLSVRLSDNTTKRFKGKLRVKPSLNSDKEGSQT